MIIKCFRCQKTIDSPNPANADYIIAADGIVTESVPVIVAVHHNAATLATRVQMKETEEYQDTTMITITDAGDSAWEIGQVVALKEYEAEKKKLDALVGIGLKSLSGTTPVTMSKLKYPDLVVLDKDYTRTVVPDLVTGHAIPNLIRVEPDVQEVEIQKTAIVCPSCYNVNDFVIWGIHKTVTAQQAQGEVKCQSQEVGVAAYIRRTFHGLRQKLEALLN